MLVPLNNESARGQDLPRVIGGIVHLDVEILFVHAQHRVNQRGVRVVGNTSQVETRATVRPDQHPKPTDGLRCTRRRPPVRAVPRHHDHDRHRTGQVPPPHGPASWLEPRRHSRHPRTGPHAGGPATRSSPTVITFTDLPLVDRYGM
jgi:hypothetical protein